MMNLPCYPFGSAAEANAPAIVTHSRKAVCEPPTAAPLSAGAGVGCISTYRVDSKQLSNLFEKNYIQKSDKPFPAENPVYEQPE
jgi:hypothetical protein